MKTAKPSKQSRNPSSLTPNIPTPMPFPPDFPRSSSFKITKSGWIKSGYSTTNVNSPLCLILLVISNAPMDLFLFVTKHLKKTGKLEECLYATWPVIHGLPEKTHNIQSLFGLHYKTATTDPTNSPEEQALQKKFITKQRSSGFDFIEFERMIGSTLFDNAWSMNRSDILDYLESVAFDIRKIHPPHPETIKMLIQLPFCTQKSADINAILKYARTDESLSSIDINHNTLSHNATKVQSYQLKLLDEHGTLSKIISHFWLDVQNEHYVIQFIDRTSKQIPVRELLEEGHQYEIHTVQKHVVASGLIVGALLTYGSSMNNTYLDRSISQSIIKDQADENIMRDRLIQLITKFGISINIPRDIGVTDIRYLLLVRIDMPPQYIADILIAEIMTHSSLNNLRSICKQIISENRFDILSLLMTNLPQHHEFTELFNSKYQHYYSAVLLPSFQIGRKHITQSHDSIIIRGAPTSEPHLDIQPESIIELDKLKQLKRLTPQMNSIYMTAMEINYDPNLSPNLLTNQIIIITAHLCHHRSLGPDERAMKKACEIISSPFETGINRMTLALFDLGKVMLTHPGCSSIQHIAQLKVQRLSQYIPAATEALERAKRASLFNQSKWMQVIISNKAISQEKSEKIKIDYLLSNAKKDQESFYEFIREQLPQSKKQNSFKSSIIKESKNPTLVEKDKQKNAQKAWKLFSLNSLQSEKMANLTSKQQHDIARMYHLYQKQLFKLYNYQPKSSLFDFEEINSIEREVLSQLDPYDAVSNSYIILKWLKSTQPKRTDLSQAYQHYHLNHLKIDHNWLLQISTQDLTDANQIYEQFYKKIALDPIPTTQIEASDIAEQLHYEVHWLLSYLSFMHEAQLEAHLYHTKRLLDESRSKEIFPDTHPIYNLGSIINLDDHRQTANILTNTQQQHIQKLMDIAGTLTTQAETPGATATSCSSP